MTIYFVRHIKTVINPNKEASEWDIDQQQPNPERKILDSLNSIMFDKVIVSEEKKTHQTAMCIFGSNVDYHVDARLNELSRVGFIDNYETHVREVFYNSSYGINGWESAQNCLKRIIDFLDEYSSYLDQNICLIGHGLQAAILRSFLLAQDTVNPMEWRSIKMPDVCVLEYDNLKGKYLLTNDFEGIQELYQSHRITQTN